MATGNVRALLAGVTRMYIGKAWQVSDAGVIIPGDVMPDISVALRQPWPGTWIPAGLTQGGVRATFARTYSRIGNDQSYSAAYQLLTSTDESIGTTFLENTLERIKQVLGGAGKLTTVAAGTQVVAPATTPALTAAATGGSLATGSYTLQIAARGPNGGLTTPSPATTVAVAGPTGTISLTLPALPGTATGWDVFISEAPGSSVLRRQLANNAAGAVTITALSADIATAQLAPTTNTSGYGYRDLAIVTPEGAELVSVGFEGKAPPNDKGLPRRVVFPMVLSTGPAEVGQGLADVTKLAATFSRVGGEEANPLIRDVVAA